MSQSQSPPLIYSKIPLIMADMEAVGKTNKNQAQGWNFRSIDAIKNASNPIFAKHGVFYTPEVLEQSSQEVQTTKGGKMYHYRIKVKYTLHASDGSSVPAIVWGEAADTSDKGLGKAQTYAEKVMLCQVLNIPTEDLPDPDSDAPELAPEPKPKPPTAKPKPIPQLVSQAQLTRLYAKANELGWTKAEAKLEIEKFGYKSSKDILKKDYEAIYSAIENPK